MGEVKDNDVYEEELLNYEEEDEKAPDSVASKAAGESAKKLVFFFFGLFSLSFFLAKLELCLVAGKVKDKQRNSKTKK